MILHKIPVKKTGILCKERLRDKAGRRAIVVVGIVDPVRVELEVVVVVEVRRVAEIAISVRKLLLSIRVTRELKGYH